jgi:two-component system LytT family response regulator
MKILIIDDNRLARTELKILLKDFPDMEVVGQAQNAEEARDLIESEDPDLLFLDIEMPGESGFDLLQSLDFAPYVIFTTAHNQYAIKAFEVDALDYLIKPIEPTRLTTALTKVSQRIKSDKAHVKPTTQFFVKDAEHCWFIRPEDLRLVECDGHYCRLYFNDKKPLISRSLVQIEAILPQNLFFKANRNQLINLKHIAQIKPWFSGGLLVIMSDGKEVEMSRRAARLFKSMNAL